MAQTSLKHSVGKSSNIELQGIWKTAFAELSEITLSASVRNMVLLDRKKSRSSLININIFWNCSRSGSSVIFTLEILIYCSAMFAVRRIWISRCEWCRWCQQNVLRCKDNTDTAVIPIMFLYVFSRRTPHSSCIPRTCMPALTLNPGKMYKYVHGQ